MKKTKMKYGYLWATLTLFIITLIGHWTAGWLEYKQDQREHNAAVEFSGYVVKMTRGTLENWQSEFLQLCWQVGGLSFLWYVGSPQSKEGDDRKEALLEEILHAVNPKDADAILGRLTSKYPKQ